MLLHRLNRFLRSAASVLVLILAVMIAVNASTARAQSAPTDRNGRAEVRFLEGMIDHHQMALDMSSDCLKKAQADAVKALCTAIITTQSTEIGQMTGWLLAWYGVTYKPAPMMGIGMGNDGHDDHFGTPATPAMGGMDMGGMGGMDPVGMMGMMAGLGNLTGKQYDVAWLEAMIDHHDDAVHMSNRLLPRATHPELKAFAENIIKVQTAEIAQMEALIQKLN